MGRNRNFVGSLLGLVMAAIGLALMAVSWVGWTAQFGALWALVALILSLVAGFNGYGLVGAFLFGQHVLNWPMEQCLALSAVGLLFLTPGVMGNVAEFLSGGDRFTPPDA